MEPERFADRDVPVSPQVVDAALRAFWRGFVRPVDRLAGGADGEEAAFGEFNGLPAGFSIGAAGRPSEDDEEENVTAHDSRGVSL